jgi:hypothetical protein
MDGLCGQRPLWPFAALPNARPLDACLGVPGIPQSATGQTTLLTGVNAAQLEGRHRRAYPTGQLRKLLAREGLPARLVAGGRRVTFINAFRASSLERIARGTYPATATTCAMLGAGIPLRGVTELASAGAVYHDLTGEGLQDPAVAWVSPREAGRRAGEIARQHDFSLFEYFLTDVAGHRRDLGLAISCLEALDAFLGGALEVLAGRGILVLSSDHGNVEDLATGEHTVNPVPLAWSGSPPVAIPPASLVHIAPLILSWLEVPPDEPG